MKQLQKAEREESKRVAREAGEGEARLDRQTCTTNKETIATQGPPAPPQPNDPFIDSPIPPPIANAAIDGHRSMLSVVISGHNVANIIDSIKSIPGVISVS